jgi:hypothetical protein
MWVNVRPYLGRDDISNMIVPLTVAPRGAGEGITVGELERGFRASFDRGIKQRAWLDELKGMVTHGASDTRGSSFFDVSNVGYFPTTGPFVDTWSQSSERAMACNSALPIAAVTVFGKENARLTLRLPYSQHVFTRSDASRAFCAIRHYLQHVRRSDKVGDAIRQMRAAVEESSCGA